MAGAGIRPNQHQWPSVGPPPTPSAVSSTARPHPPSVHHHHHPPPAPVLVDNHNHPPYDELRTIFILGLPNDVKERELPNLLRWLPGYEASQVNFKGDKPMGFALFSTPQSAMAAIDTLQHLVFDAESKSVIHTEMAKKNLFLKRGRVRDSNTYDQSKRLRTGGDCSPSPFHPPPPPVWGQPPHGYMAPAPPPYDPNAGYRAPSVPMHAPALYDPFADYHSPSVPMPAPAPASAPIAAPSSYVPVKIIKDNPPCNTLFIGNLGESINEEELRNLLSAQPGFKQMKILRQERHIVCFIEFEDVYSATNVHHNLQGAVIPSSGSFGMRIQYSKNPFGKRKEEALTYQ